MMSVSFVVSIFSIHAVGHIGFKPLASPKGRIHMDITNIQNITAIDFFNIFVYFYI
jgi:hypothetical protein